MGPHLYSFFAPGDTGGPTLKRFISPDELARDSRFKRANNRNQLLRSLPDNVDTVVEILEKVGPRLRQRVAGTALEKVYDELGPGFSFLMNSGDVRKNAAGEALQLKLRLHGIFVATSKIMSSVLLS